MSIAHTLCRLTVRHTAQQQGLCRWSLLHSVSPLPLTNRSGLLRHKQASKIYNTNEKNVRHTDNVVLRDELTPNIDCGWSLQFTNNHYFARIPVGVPYETCARVDSKHTIVIDVCIQSIPKLYNSPNRSEITSRKHKF